MSKYRYMVTGPAGPTGGLLMATPGKADTLLKAFDDIEKHIDAHESLMRKADEPYVISIHFERTKAK